MIMYQTHNPRAIISLKHHGIYIKNDVKKDKPEDLAYGIDHGNPDGKCKHIN
jgi:hypothetical protein